MTDYKSQATELVEAAEYLLSDLLPSEWAEANRHMSTEVSPFPGPFSFKRTPYLREVCDCVSPNHPAHTIAVMKGAQIGFSTGVIENNIGFIISESPAPILFLTGHADLTEEAMSGKIDQMIDSCGLRPLIKPNVLRKRNQRTGDTNKSKEFPGGSLVAGSASNHKLLRQRSVRYAFIDDFDAAKKWSKESGSTNRLIQQRLAAYADKRKLFLISTPEVKQTSNIEPAYLLGDQRRYNCPCPKCGDFIAWYWTTERDGKTYGITYEISEEGELVDGSVGYTCQSCGEFFTDKDKDEMLGHGEWKATAKPSTVGYYSYHISALYAPAGMYNWEHYVRQYLEANPREGKQDAKLMQTFMNVVLGETYEEKGESPKANALQRNTRDYDVGDIPEKLSEEDGNGTIVLLTCACDLNGKVDDARLDYEIIAWSESGASYSVSHGSIGTFIPNESGKKIKKDREHWTYRIGEHNNVWDQFTEVIGAIYETDTDRRMKIVLSGVDTGHYTKHAYDYIESQKGHNLVFGLKGIDKYKKYNADISSHRLSKERGDLYLVEVNHLKDELADCMKLRWNQNSDQPQPPGFMNFPIPANGLYTYRDFYSHFESEHRVTRETDAIGMSTRWVKRNSAAQNHLWDVRVYGMVLRDIMVSLVGKEMKLRHFSWKELVDVMLQKS